MVRTLSNAIEQDKVHHAYLFVGSRGTGKTSMAKILAASLNCEQGPTRHAVRRLRVVRDDRRARRSLDVIEMDAASNNSVDDIRDLREKVAYAPVSGPPQGLHPRRGAHALHRGVERVPQDARGAAAAHDLRARHDRGQQGAADGRRPLPPLRLRPPDGGPDRRGAAARRRRRADLDPRRGVRADRALGHGLVPRRARHARAAARLLGRLDRARGRARGARRRRRRPAVRRRRRGRRRRRAAPRCWPPPGWPSRGATSAASSPTSRRTRAR